MKIIKKLLIIGLCLIMTCSLFGCNKSASEIEGYSRIVKCYIGQEGVFEDADLYEFDTNNPSILQIDGSSYLAKAEGKATVTVREKNSDGVAVLLFVVFGEKPIDIQELSIQGVPAENSVSVAEEVGLTYVKTPADSNNYEAIVWSSDNPDVLSIDGAGNVKANKMGTATLTVKALGTNVEAQTTINVLPRETLFYLNHTSIVGVMGTTEEVLSSTVRTDYPFDEAVTWFTEDDTVVDVDNGTLEFKSVGKTNVGIQTTINGTPYKATCAVSVCEDQGYTVIRTPEQLQEIKNVSTNYMLGNDIDLADACAKGGSLYNSGKGFTPLFDSAKESFKGVFNGNGFAIKNLYINREGEPFVAFMRYISAEAGKEGKIINLSLIDAEIRGGNYTSVFYANASGNGSVQSGLENCYAEVSLYSLGSCSALVGNNKGVVKNCITVAKIDAIGKVNLFALNHTLESDKFGVENCVYVGESDAEMAELKTGGYVKNCKNIQESEVSTFDFGFLDNGFWTIASGVMPVLKGV